MRAYEALANAFFSSSDDATDRAEKLFGFMCAKDVPHTAAAVAGMAAMAMFLVAERVITAATGDGLLRDIATLYADESFVA